MTATMLLAGAQSAPAHGDDFPRVTIAGSQLRTVKSVNTGRDYDIQVLLPSDYARNTSARYPVLYVLDGQWDFKLLASVEGGLLYDKYVPEMIIVGITYPGANPDYNALRAMDLTPMPSASNPGSGDGPKFLAFIETELIPFMATNYRADPTQRVLLGSSLGGLFTLYAMFTRPELFTGCIASSPAVTYADRNAFAFERAYAASHQSLAGRLYVSVGEESRVVQTERHSGNKPESFNRGLRFVFGGKP